MKGGWSKRFLVVAALALAGLRDPRGAAAAYAPKVAVVFCPDTYAANAEHQRKAQMSSQALVGLAGLVGTPYDTVMLDELLARPAGTYNSVWFSNCAVLSDPNVPKVAAFLTAHLARGGTVLLDGPIGAYTPPFPSFPDLPFRGTDATAPILNISALGQQEVLNWTVRTAAAGHPLAAWPGWTALTTLTQGLADSTDVVGIADPKKPGSNVLLELSNGKAVFPYLVATRPGTGRVLAISGFGCDAGPATPFRNSAPRGFFDNLLLPRLIDAVLWLLAPEGPSVGLQLSNAPLTVVARLDGDQSDVPEATTRTLDYLLAMGRETGVTTAYGVVSSFAERVAWEGFFPRAPEIEQLGGAIASHSHTHNYQMSLSLDAAGWDTEVRQSMALVRQHFTVGTFQPAVQVYINPGDEILWADYQRFFALVRTYFTHGFETEVPYASGISGFGLPAGVAPVALISDIAVPDVQWLYDKMWTYTVEAATNYQKQILAYYQRRIGRGVLYNQMWHDYAIANSPPLHFPPDGDHPVYSHFDASREHFAREKIFAPGIAEVTTKLHIAQRTRLSAETGADGTTTTTLDLSKLAPEQRSHLAGMGLRINRAAKPIAAVTIDGARYPAFSADTVILPPGVGESLVIAAQTGDAPAGGPRLTYLSKEMAAIDGGDDFLHVELAAPGLFTRFCLALPPGFVVLGADYYWREAGETCGALAYGSQEIGFDVRALEAPSELSIVGADRHILDAHMTKGHVDLDLAAGQAGDRIFFATKKVPMKIYVGAEVRTADKESEPGTYSFEIGRNKAATARLTFITEDPPVEPAGPGGAGNTGPACSLGGFGSRGLGGGALLAAAGLGLVGRMRRRRGARSRARAKVAQA